MGERLYLVAYDIRHRRRWRRVHGLLQDTGHPVQLSIFQCRLDTRRLNMLLQQLMAEIDHSADAVLVIDLGAPATAPERLRSLGVPFTPARLEVLIV